MLNVFISYSHADTKYKDELIKHLSVMQRNGLITTWTDKQIVAGEEWSQEISDALNEAELILLLISPDFLYSDYCYDIEMNNAIARHKEKKAKVIPIILRPCDWHDTPFAKLQALPTAGKPIVDWPDPDKFFEDIVSGLKNAILVLLKKSRFEIPPLTTETLKEKFEDIKDRIYFDPRYNIAKDIIAATKTIHSEITEKANSFSFSSFFNTISKSIEKKMAQESNSSEPVSENHPAAK